jgi:transglutaminase-like putative cysteine protease
VENGFFYQLFEEQIQIEKQADYKHVIREIVSAAGIQNGSEISISFDPSYERLDIHDITVWRDGKANNRLNLKSFKVIADEKELSRFIYQGSFSAFCILDDIRKGDRIEYSYTITGRNPIFGSKYTDDLYLQLNQPYAQIYKALFASPQHKLNFKAFNKAPAAVISGKNGLTCYEWNMLQTKVPPYADNQPAWFDNYQHIQISDYASWQEVTSWALSVNPVATSLKGELAARVARLKAEAGNDKEKYFRAAAQMVQDEVRYMGIELGEYSHRANTPERVYSQRYGDCKDKAMLLAAVLTANGIEAHMVLINSTAGKTLGDYAPSPTVFDHATCQATLNGKPVYVDATIASQRGTGTNIYFPNYGKGLVLKSGTNSLTDIAPSKSGRMVLTENFTVPEDATGIARLEVISTYTLNEADRIRDKLASTSMAETEKSYLDFYTKSYPKIEPAADSITVKDDQESNEITTTEHYRIPKYFKADKEPGQYYASFFGAYINNQLPDISSNAKLPVALNYPSNIEYKVNVVMDNGWNIDKSTTNITRDAYTFRSEISVLKDTLTLDYKFSTLKDFIAVDQLDEARTDAKQIADNELGYSFTYTPDASKVPFHLNYWMLLFGVGLAVLLGLLGIRLYRTETHGVLFAPGAGFIPIGGWLIVVAIGLGITPFAVSYTLISGNYFDVRTWNTHTAGIDDAAFKALFAFEAAGNIFCICYAIFCLVLLINKRDILPKYITGFYAYLAVFAVADCIFAVALNGDVSDDTASSMVRKIIYAAVWISYFKRSVRVEQTFIVPYPAHNYAYEKLETNQEAGTIA